MTLINLPLAILAILFFGFFSPIYAWGMLRWFHSSSDRTIIKWDNDKKRYKLQSPPYRFSWSIASTIGIASVVTMSHVFGLVSLQDVWNLAIVFLAALPGMIYVDQKLKKNLIDKIANLKKQIGHLYTILRAYEAHFDDLQKRVQEVDKKEELRN